MPGMFDNPEVLGGTPVSEPAPQAKSSSPGRSFGDAVSARKLIFDNSLKSASKLPPITNKRHSLELSDVHYADDRDFTPEEQKQAILHGKTLTRRMRGTWTLRDLASGQPIDTKTQTIAHIPYMTDRGTVIHNGNEYTFVNQLRLLPGIYSREKENGEIEAHVNTKGTGAHRYFLDPAKGVFYTRIHQAKIPLLPLLRVLGVKDKQLQEAWGPELYSSNLQSDEPAALRKYEDKLLRANDKLGTDESKRAKLKEIIEGMELDPVVNHRTLGHPHANLNLDAILAATKKLIGISRGEVEPDDRDSLAYQKVYGPEDTIAERFSKDYGGVRRQLLSRASFAGSLKPVLPSALSKQVESALLGSGLGQYLEEINAAEILDKQGRVTRMGEGGLMSTDQIPFSARDVHGSQLSFIDPTRTPENFKAGVDLHFARAARKGENGEIYAPFVSPKSGKTVYRSPRDVENMAVAFPREMESPRSQVLAMKGGRIQFVPRDKVDLVMPHFENAFSPLANLVPFKSGVKGQRTAMGSRFLTQALPLVDPEAPLVQSGMPDQPGTSFHEHYGEALGAIKAKQGGRVIDSTPDNIKVRYDDGNTQTYNLYHEFPHNKKTLFNQTPVVQRGDVFQKGQSLVRSNYTDQNGVTALGKNARVGYMAWKGKNYEDAIVISKSMADRLSSEHLHQHRLDYDDDIKPGRGKFISIFPGEYPRHIIDQFDEDGVIKPGTKVDYEHPLILAARQRAGGKGKFGFTNASTTWEYKTPGIVTDVAKGPDGATVLVKSISPMEEGDKMSGLYGNKGIVSSIVPDEQMPHDKDGRPLEVLMNPLGIISRGNPAQIIEAALGKIAAKTGQPYKIADFEDIGDSADFAMKELRKHGLSDTEDLVDPETGRKIPDVLTGNAYMLKLQYTAEDKQSGRGIGGYTADESPARGGTEGSKRLSMLDLNALLSHGVPDVIRDASEIRGQKHDDYWLQYMQGYNPPTPKVPFVYKKFVNELKGAGVNVVPDGPQLKLMALTDKDIDKLSGGREVKSGETVRFEKNMEPVKGGLFDPELHGGGDRWSHIKLHEAMPSPVMEDPIRKLLGLTEKKFQSVLAGKETIATGTGPQAIGKALENINVKKEIALARMEIQSGRKTARDTAVRKLRYLTAADRTGIHPGEWMLSKAPVLPPAFRPISMLTGTNTPVIADPNSLYKELIDANDNLRELASQTNDTGEERLAVYNAFKAVTGLGDPTHPKLVQKNVQGLLAHVLGHSPKFSAVQRRLLSKPVDLVGRAVIGPDPDLDIDHVGIPEHRAWEVYKPFVIRRLRRQGWPLGEAVQQFQNKSPAARKEMLSEMEERPVFVNRAPVLHKFGILAFWPKLIAGNIIRMPTQVYPGFGADNDGDAVQWHVPVSDEAKKQAIERMLPSRNLFSAGDFKTPMFKPTQEYLGGLFAATAKPSKKQRAHRFVSAKHAIQAYLRGELPINTPVDVDI